MRSILVLTLLAFAAGCSSSTSDDASDSTAAVVAADPNADLIAHLKAAYEAAPGNASILADAKDVDGTTLTGNARDAFDEYANTSSWGLIDEVGSPIAQVGTFEGKTVYFVAGDLSDTGAEYGFYDADGNALAVAYTGQGEHPGPGGVDWEK